MPTSDQRRLAQDRARPRITELWWALRPLTSVIRFMQTGAHPDDETSAMMAALAFRDGLNISYACSTRGEGGQNDIGTETGAELGALRTREMERACDILGMRMYWHSTAPEDRITDFGFSKSGRDTLARWGHDRTRARFVEIIRSERPDIICPTFLDVPGQHGHHRAMTEAAHEVMAAAADPGFPSNLPPWQISKLYLPAWSGAGQAYDDDLPPPPATLTIMGRDNDPVTGWSWRRIGEHSRAFHRTQGMGRWVPCGTGADWPLHLAESHVEGPDEALWSGLPRRLDDLAELHGTDNIAANLRTADAAIDRAMAAFPDGAAIAEAAAEALRELRQARSACPPEIAHRLEAKEQQLARVLALALGVQAEITLGDPFLTIGTAYPITRALDPGAAESATLDWDLPQGWSISDETLSITEGAPPHDPYRSHYDPLAPHAPCAKISFSANGIKVDTPVAFEPEPVPLPAASLALDHTAFVVNRAAPRPVEIFLKEVTPKEAKAELTLPPGWTATAREAGFTVTPGADAAPGLYEIAVTLDGKPAQICRKIAYDHIAPTLCSRPAKARVAVIDVALPRARVGYIGGGNDRVGHWLAAMGADVTDITDDLLAEPGSLEAFDSIVIGIFAMRFRPGLADAMVALHRWMEAGGTLVTLYHRPWDNWDPDRIPPRHLEIGQPSLRWRVTDEAAAVTHLTPHPILEHPNRITDQDWAGWVKERGLYFAKSWDAAYRPLLAMSDPGEDPLTGSLLVADIGKGRHIHTSLILHHQMEHLVPGAFRLMANFIARRA